MAILGRLEEITDLRAIWQNESKDFTEWLAKEENINLLAESAGLEMSAEETQSPVGKFHVDILASESGTNRRIIIISNFSQTDDSGLGRLITLAAGKNADIIIWIVRNAQEEHKAAVEWLISRTRRNTGIFLCEVKLFRIGSSEPAVKFEVISRPNNWAKEVRKISEDFRITLSTEEAIQNSRQATNVGRPPRITALSSEQADPVAA